MQKKWGAWGQPRGEAQPAWEEQLLELNPDPGLEPNLPSPQGSESKWVLLGFRFISFFVFVLLALSGVPGTSWVHNKLWMK